MTRPSARELTIGLVESGVLAGVVLLLGTILGHVTGRRYVLSGAAGLAPVVVLGRHLVRRLRAYAPRGLPAVAPPARSTHGSFARLEALETRLRSDPRHGDQFGFTVRPVLVAVLEDRLRRHHGVDLFTEPARARGLVDEKVWELLERSSGDGPPEIAQLHAALRRIEAL